jgi:hypothetical protein
METSAGLFELCIDFPGSKIEGGFEAEKLVVLKGTMCYGFQDMLI